jgi:RNA ligase
MLVLTDLIDPAELAAAVEAKHVKIRQHPTLPLLIHNYTDLCMYDRGWNDVTEQCRGLITDARTGRVVARPWRKFFNHGEHEAADLDLAAAVEVTDKKDGSLGILYSTADPLAPNSHGPCGCVPCRDNWAIATRGSFASEQAAHATQLYLRRYAPACGWSPWPEWTYLFEIVYPANRIVLDYGDTDNLILLGAAHIETGRLAGPDHQVCCWWPGPRAEVFAHATLADALAATPRPNAEGLVIRYLDGDRAGLMVKLKQDDYVAAHRLMTGMTARRLWERCAVHSVARSHPDLPLKRIARPLHLSVDDVREILDAGPGWLDDVRKRVPEEFVDWVEATVAGFEAKIADSVRMVAAAAAAVAGLPRREAAAAIAQHPLRPLIFLALDGRPLAAAAWAQIRPEHERPFMSRGEDVA